MGAQPVTERPLTVQQRQMLKFIGSRVDDYYLNLEAFVVCGPLDLPALRSALASVLARHETLRSTYPAGRAVYRVLAPTTEPPEAVCRVEAAVDVPRALATGIAWAGAPMALDKRPPLRFWIGTVDPRQHVVVIAGHYLVFDAWSFILFYQDLAAEYRRARQPGPERPAPPQYHEIGGQHDDGPLDGWDDVFGRHYPRMPIPAPLGPVVDNSRPAHPIHGSIALAAKLHRATPYVLGAAAMLRTLADTLAVRQVVIGTPFGARSTADAADTIGFLATTIFVGVDLDTLATTEKLVAEVNRQLRRWYDNPRTQWQPLLARYDASEAYLAKFVFLPHRFARPDLVLDGVSTERLRPPAGTSARRPIELTAAYGRGSVWATLKYRSDMLDTRTADALVDGFLVRLDEICAG